MNEKQSKLLRRITAEAWGKYGDKLFVVEEIGGTMRKVLELSLTKEKHRFTEAQLDKMQNIKDSGMLEGTRKVEDPKVAKKLERYVEKRIKEEIEAGNLSKPEQALKKVKKYGKRIKKD